MYTTSTLGLQTLIVGGRTVSQFLKDVPGACFGSASAEEHFLLPLFLILASRNNLQRFSLHRRASIALNFGLLERQQSYGEVSSEKMISRLERIKRSYVLRLWNPVFDKRQDDEIKQDSEVIVTVVVEDSLHDVGKERLRAEMLMIRNSNQSFFFLNFLLLVIFTTSCSTMSTLLGGLRDSHTSEQNSAEIDELARFAVDDHNKKQNSLLEFVKVVKAQEQVVVGTLHPRPEPRTEAQAKKKSCIRHCLHHLTIEAIDGGNKKLYDTKIWVKPWMNFKEVQEFKHAGSGASSLTSSYLCVKKDGHAPGFQVDAAKHIPAPELPTTASRFWETLWDDLG
ncbi:uncharacterized protein LOC124909691 [Impatiens glandulifera]|uniref:uncharacterized protein LOC124909691 n=1 Tax=Impatiens glandulifera TaxID=253017 RepID=UPI001FB1644F|nr:uncharacterized protein LOC124909691 [Impatiens glandulifera]